MAKASTKKVFVVYGRNVDAYREMKKYLAYIGATEESFDQVANTHASPYVTEVVIQGIQRADAVIVLFTPDELAALHDTSADMSDGLGSFRESRWQARPNVIFEAGIAFGSNQSATVLVALGRDVAGFSDIGGVHIVHLDNEVGKISLRDRLQLLLGKLPKLKPNWHRSQDSGDFAKCIINRWPFYDELESLEKFLAAKSVFLETGRKKIKAKAKTLAPIGGYRLSDIVRRVATHDTKNWAHSEPREFVEFIKQRFNEDVADKAYWWLIVAGFFQFQDTDHWFDSDDSWEHSVDYAKFSARGLALIQKLRATAVLPDGVSR